MLLSFEKCICCVLWSANVIGLMDIMGDCYNNPFALHRQVILPLVQSKLILPDSFGRGMAEEIVMFCLL